MEFWLSGYDKGAKAPRRDHLKQIMRKTGKWPASAPRQADCPGELAYVWTWFLRCKAANNHEPLAPERIESWARITGTRIEPFEAELMFKLDQEHRRWLTA